MDDGGEDPPSGSPVNSPAVGKNGGSPVNSDNDKQKGESNQPDSQQGNRAGKKPPPTEGGIREHFGEEESEEDQVGEDEEESVEEAEAMEEEKVMDDGGEDPPSGSPVNSPAVGKNGGSSVNSDDDKHNGESNQPDSQQVNRVGKEPTPTEGGEGSPDGKRGGDPPARSPPTKSPATTGGSSINSDDDKQKEGEGNHPPSQLRATPPAKEKGSTRSTHSRAEKGIGKKADVSTSAAIAEASTPSSGGGTNVGDSTTPEAKGGEVPATSNQVRDAQAALNFTTPKHRVAPPPSDSQAGAATALKLDLLEKGLNQVQGRQLEHEEKKLEREEKFTNALKDLSNNHTRQANTLAQTANVVGDIYQKQAQNTKDIAQNTKGIAQNTTDIAQNTKDLAQNTKDLVEQGQQLGKQGQQIADLKEGQADLTKTVRKVFKKELQRYLEVGALSPDSTDGTPIQRPLFSEGGNQKGGAAAPPVAAASIESLYGGWNNVVSNDDDDDANRRGSMEGFAKDENGGEDQCDVASACDKLRGIESADLTPEQVHMKIIPTIVRVLQDSGITNEQRLVALRALKHVLGVGRNNKDVAYDDFVRKAFDDYGGVSLYQFLVDLQVPENYSKEVCDLTKSIVVEYYTAKEGGKFLAILTCI